MGHVGSKTRLLGHISIKPCPPSRGQFCFSLHETLPESLLMIYWSSLNMDHAVSKTRSRGQISLKPFSPSGGHIFSSIFVKLYQNVCLYDNLFIYIIIMNLAQNVYYDDF